MGAPITSNAALSKDLGTIRIYGIVDESIVDGPGLRTAIFVQGCSHNCPGCHNPESHAPSGGEEMSIASIVERIRGNKLIRNVTLSGGEPFEQPHASATLAQALKAEGYGVWSFSGYLFEDLQKKAAQDADIAALLEAIDVLVDGPFVQSLRSIELDWRGSSNQRVIDMEKTRAAGAIVEWKQPALAFEKPANW